VTEFGRSAWYGIIGVFVVAAICVAIGLSADPTDSNPKLQFGLIFGVIAVFLVGLFFFQSRDLGRAEQVSRRAIASGPHDVDDPTRLSEPDLWAALAVKPIDSEAAKARGEMWGAARRSMRLGILICVLIFLTVPPIYLLDTFVTLYVGVPLIVAAALFGVIRAVGRGGEVDQGFERIDRAMAPLGLSMVERPEIQFEPRMPPLWGVNASLGGQLLMEGRRHGRPVSVSQVDAVSTTTVKAAAPSFEAKARDGRIGAGSAAPHAIAAVLAELPNSTRWKGVKVRGGSAGIAVERKGDPGAWLCDLWLAELLAQKLTPAVARGRG
jgi:hypothetical protein